VAIDLADSPAWYKEKVYPANKVWLIVYHWIIQCIQHCSLAALHAKTSHAVGQVPALEHNNQVKGESLDLVKYIDSNFDGPALLPDVRKIYSIFRLAMLVKMSKKNLVSINLLRS
jgi:glutathione S-transferase